MRGRKIKARFQDPTEEVEAEAEPELSTETGEISGGSSTPAGEAKAPEQYISIDGDDLQYRSSITWECFPGNIEVLVNTERYFLSKHSSFTMVGSEWSLIDAINKAVEKIWSLYDVDNSGVLEKDEAKDFLATVLKDVPGAPEFNEAVFEQQFEKIDLNKDGLIQRGEMFVFIRSTLKASNQ
jgi:hypothetical protein